MSSKDIEYQRLREELDLESTRREALIKAMDREMTLGYTILTLEILTILILFFRLITILYGAL
jgi:hypothetical protein